MRSQMAGGHRPPWTMKWGQDAVWAAMGHLPRFSGIEQT
jgi:hypothetical protein